MSSRTASCRAHSIAGSAGAGCTCVRLSTNQLVARYADNFYFTSMIISVTMQYCVFTSYVQWSTKAPLMQRATAGLLRIGVVSSRPSSMTSEYLA